MTAHRCVAFSVLFAAALVRVSSAAEAPKFDRLSPPGGQRGVATEVKLIGKAGDGRLQVWSDRAQLEFAFNEKNDGATVKVPNDAEPGLHWLRFYNEHGAGSLVPFIVGLIPEVAEAEPNNASSECQAIDVPAVTVNGVLAKSGDVDVYSVTASSGQTIVASMQASQDLSSPMDGVLQLLNSAGGILVHNDDDHGFDPQLTYDVTQDGTYYIRTFAFPATPNSTIRLAGAATYVYRLTLTTGPFVSHTVPLTVSRAAETSSVALHGWNLGPQPVSVAVPAVEREAYSLTEQTALPFVITSIDSPAIAESSVAADIPVPATVTGTVSAASERDTYTFVADSDKSLTVTVDARSVDSLLDPVITVTGKDGKVLKESDDRSREDLDAQAAFKVPANGQFTVAVTDRYGNGGDRYFYLLTCEESRPDYRLALKNDVFVLPADKTLEIPVTIERKNGYAENIQITADGLPPGVTAAAVTSEPKGDTAKSVTLKLVRDKNTVASSGIFTVIGTGSDPETRRVAAAESAAGKPTEVWLTVIAPPSSESSDAASDEKEKDADSQETTKP